MVTFISTWAPKRMFDFIVGFIIRKGLSRRLERVARKLSLNQPPEKERLLIKAEREIAAEKERQALEEKMRENKFERSLGEVSGEDIYYNRVTNQTMIINKKTGEVKIR